MPDGFAVAECPACGLVSTSPALPASEIGRYYPETYYGKKNRRFNPVLEKLVVFFRLRRVREIERRAARGRVLDVGCGRGILPALMRTRGWDAHGVEISSTAARHAIEELGVPVFVGPLEESDYPEGFFDAVVIWHVLEHVQDPRAALAKARAILKPGGLLMVAVPNFDSLQAKAGGPVWFHLDVPRHYFHFRLRVLRKLLEEQGFTVEKVSHFSLEQNPYGWIQTLLNRLGIRANLLYDLLKRRGARSVGSPWRESPGQTLATLAALPLVVPLSFLLFLLEATIRRGGTVEVYARRKA